MKIEKQLLTVIVSQWFLNVKCAFATSIYDTLPFPNHHRIWLITSNAIYNWMWLFLWI